MKIMDDRKESKLNIGELNLEIQQLIEVSDPERPAH